MVNVTVSGAAPLAYAERGPRLWSAHRFLVWAVGSVVIGGMLMAVLLPSLCRSS